MKRIVPFVLASFGAAALWLGLQSGHDQTYAQVVKPAAQKKAKKPAAKPGLGPFMRQKLEASNDILEGLVTDNMELVGRGSDQLLKLGKAEQWRITNDPTYARFSKDFERVVERLKDKSKNSTADGAALAWLDVTMSCIECHEWVRNMIVADAELKLSPVRR